MPSDNLRQLIAAARLLRPLLKELVFVGGSVTELLVTDEGAAEPRSTLDVDAIVGSKSYGEYTTFGEKLRRLGFSEDTSEGAPICRWVHKETILDVMPLDENTLGFSNRWYRAAMETATMQKLAAGVEIRVVTAPYFVATKLEAFKGRGKGDYLGSRDLEDLITLVDGRDSLLDEIQAESPELRVYVGSEIRSLMAKRNFIDALPGFLLPDSVSQARVGMVLDRLRGLAAIQSRMTSVEKIRAVIESERALLVPLQKKVKAKYLKNQCQTALNYLSDVEHLFLDGQDHTELLLRHATIWLDLAAKARLGVEKAVATYGYTAVVIPDDAE